MPGGACRAIRNYSTRGLVDRTVVEASEEAVDLARRNLFDVMRRRDELGADDLSRRNEIKIRLADAKQDHLEAERQVKELEALIEPGASARRFQGG